MVNHLHALDRRGFHRFAVRHIPIEHNWICGPILKGILLVLRTSRFTMHTVLGQFFRQMASHEIRWRRSLIRAIKISWLVLVMKGKKFELVSGHHYNAPASGNNLSNCVYAKKSPPIGFRPAPNG